MSGRIGTNLKKRLIFVAAALALAAALVFIFNITSPDEFFSGESPLWESGPCAELSVEFGAERSALPPELEDYVPEDGMIIAPVKLSLGEDETAWDLLIKAAKYYKIPVDAQGSGASVYVRGINQLYEFSAGELSGWVYYVNGERPSAGCGAYALSDGDEVRFVFTGGEGVVE